MKHLLAAIALALAAPAALAAAVGEVTFAAGDARVEGAGSKLAKGAQVEVGQTIVTGAGGHVHIRFVDDAFVAIRPNSQLSVDDYQYDPANAAANRVKFTLRNGTGRLITGKAGQANKQGFRLNTPMAAIGVRGTDFVVRAGSDKTLVTVQQGAVVMSPFGADCAAAASGPCAGQLARQLTAAMAGTYLEQRGQAAPVIIKSDPAKLPGLFAPPRAEEPPVRMAGATLEPLAASSPGNATGSRSAPEGLNGSSGIFWGRWDPAAHATLLSSADYQILAQSDGFVLVRPIDSGGLMVPGTGSVSFRLVQSTLLVRTPEGLARAEAVDPSLRVNFGTQSFDTAVTLRGETTTDSVHARGDITADGRFVADSRRSNADIKGGLSSSSQEAGYVFVKRGPEGISSSIGVTRWER